MSWRLVARLGEVIFAFGVLVLLFVAYQLWGTSITTQLHQDALRTQFQHELAVLRAAHTPTTSTQPAAPSTTPPTATTTSTQPLRGVAPVVPGTAPAEGQPIGTIAIPQIGADYVVVQGTGTADLELGPGHYTNTPLPGQPGNAAIAGHRTTYLHPFYNLNELTPGDPIYVETTQGRFEYEVSSIQTVDPSDVDVLQPTTVPTLTLTTCNPRYSASQRLVVQATLVTPPAPVPKVDHPAGRDAAPPRSIGGLAGQNGSPWPAVAWGVPTAALFGLVWLLARRRHRWHTRLAVFAAGLVPVLVLLFFFFQSVTPLLPASF
ncbi:MAG TPA: class E sortase [Acidimicrobiia bacterium]|nr:class E sortase [Acidimicrobiia bacterium]